MTLAAGHRSTSRMWTATTPRPVTVTTPHDAGISCHREPLSSGCDATENRRERNGIATTHGGSWVFSFARAEQLLPRREPTSDHAAVRHRLCPVHVLPLHLRLRQPHL